MYFTAIDEIVLPEYTGSAWRGLFGKGLKKTLCPVAHTKCNLCQLKQTCHYVFLFENHLQNNSKKYSANPYILNVPIKKRPKTIKKNETFYLNFNLFGDKSNIILPAIINAFIIAGRAGFKHKKFTPIRLENIDTIKSDKNTIWQPKISLQEYIIPDIAPILPHTKEYLEIIYLTPQRYKYHNRLIDVNSFNFNNWLSALLNRINAINELFADKKIQPLDIKKIINENKNIKIEYLKISKQNIIRYSTRQQTKMNLDGIVGEVILKNKNIQFILPYLHLGQFINIGKSTTMGLGRFCIIHI